MKCKECNGSKIIQSKAGKVAGHICFHCGGSGEEPNLSSQVKKTGKLVGVCNCHCHCDLWNCFVDHQAECEHCKPSPQEDWETKIRKLFRKYCNYGCDDSNAENECIELVSNTFLSHEEKIREEERERILAIARDSLGDISYEMFRIAIEE